MRPSAMQHSFHTRIVVREKNSIVRSQWPRRFANFGVKLRQEIRVLGKSAALDEEISATPAVFQCS